MSYLPRPLSRVTTHCSISPLNRPPGSQFSHFLTEALQQLGKAPLLYAERSVSFPMTPEKRGIGSSFCLASHCFSSSLNLVKEKMRSTRLTISLLPSSLYSLHPLTRQPTGDILLILLHPVLSPCWHEQTGHLPRTREDSDPFSLVCQDQWTGREWKHFLRLPSLAHNLFLNIKNRSRSCSFSAFFF